MLQGILSTVFGRDILKENGPSLDALLAQLDAHAAGLSQTGMKAAAESRPRTPFDTTLPREAISTFNFTPGQAARALPIMVPLMLSMRRAARLYDTPFSSTKRRADAGLIAELEAMAYAAGAKDITYVKVPRYAIFRDKTIPHEVAIVYTVEMAQEAMETAPSFECMLEVMRGYKQLATIGDKLSGWLRANGYAAYPGTALGGLTDYSHLAELAGLGAIGYHGLLITPGEGARLRINTIYTNIENLPLRDENPHLWVRDFCAMCRKCIRQCPPKAIFPEPRPRGDSGMQCIDHAACRDYYAANYGCAVCLAVCPFSDVGYETVKARFKGNPDAPQFRIGEHNRPAMSVV